MPKAEQHGKKAGVSEALEQLDNYWDDVEEKKFEEVPKGTYQVKVDSGTINNSKSSGRLQCSWAATIVAPKDFKGRKLFWHDGLDNEDSLGWFRGALARLGIEWPKSAKGLPEKIEEVVGTFAEVKCRPAKDSDIMNTRFVKALDSKDIPDGDEDDKVDDEPPVKVKKTKPPVDDDDEEPAKPAKKPAPAEDDDDEEPPVKKKAPAAAADDDDEEPAKPAKKPAPADDATVECTFDDGVIDKPIRIRIKAAAKANDFDPVDYTTKTSLLMDVAEHMGISGKFDDVEVLLTKVEKRIAKAVAAKAPAEDDDD